MPSSITVNRETLDKLIQNVLNTGPASSTLLSHKELPPPLDPKDYCQVRFWYANLFEEYTKKLAGETNGLATQQKRHGPHPKSEINEDPYLYLKNSDGSAIPQDVLVVVGQRLGDFGSLSTSLVWHPTPGERPVNAPTYILTVRC